MYFLAAQRLTQKNKSLLFFHWIHADVLEYCIYFGVQMFKWSYHVNRGRAS